MRVLVFSALILLLTSEHFGRADDDGFCPISPVNQPSEDCSSDLPAPKKRYVVAQWGQTPQKLARSVICGSVILFLFYDINPPEGFNLRRDVYMRLAVFMNKFKKSQPDWTLVLPPWSHLYHWQSDMEQSNLPWRLFFDVESMKRFAPVMDLDELEGPFAEIDEVFYLQHYEGAFKRKDWDWSDRFTVASCNGTKKKYKEIEGTYHTRLWGYDVDVKEVKCASFQGGASLLGELLGLTTHSKVLLDRAEVALHDHFGDKSYWECRRSMRFAGHLIEEANKFRSVYLNSSDVADHTLLPELWEDQKHITRKEKGGPYICAHLRRRDFLHGKRNEVPAVEEVADKLIELLKAYKLKTVFLCTDGTSEEKSDLKSLLSASGYTLVTYEPTIDKVVTYKDGGIAVIDQIICSNARYFIGTHESTFSYRIQEEREIKGFPVEHTFNRFCGLNQECEQPSKWKITF